MKKELPNQYPVVEKPYNNIGIDPLGSYTGRPKRPLEEPVQDADDL